MSKNTKTPITEFQRRDVEADAQAVIMALRHVDSAKLMDA